MKSALALLLSALPVLAAAGGASKDAYTLAKPTPDAQLRELNTDRPDVTESPFTVDAGHTQLEMDFANTTRTRRAGTRTLAWGVAPFNLRLGVLNNFEAGIFVSPYVRVSETPPGGPRATTSGVGDTTLRAKINFFGNDGGGPACGFIADLTLPTAARGLGHDQVEGALILPVAFELAGGWEGGAMTVAEFHHRETGGYQLAWTNSATFGHDLAKDVSGYLELTSTTGDGPHVATFDVGVAWKLNANLQLDGGLNFGLTRHADDVLGFAGISRRF